MSERTLFSRHLDNHDLECCETCQNLENGTHDLDMLRAVQGRLYAAPLPHDLRKGEPLQEMHRSRPLFFVRTKGYVNVLHEICVVLAYPWFEPCPHHNLEAEFVLPINDLVGLCIYNSTGSSYVEAITTAPAI